MKLTVSVVSVSDADTLNIKLLRPPNNEQLSQAILSATARPRSHGNQFLRAKDMLDQMVLAKINQDVYRRAICVSVCNDSTNQITCEFIDDGITKPVPLSAILPCPDDIKNYERHVKCLHIDDLQPVSWQPSITKTGEMRSSLQICTLFEEAAKYHVSGLFAHSLPHYENCQVEVKITDKLGHLHGDLKFLRDNQWISLRDDLISNNYAVAAGTKLTSSPSSSLRPEPRSTINRVAADVKKLPDPRMVRQKQKLEEKVDNSSQFKRFLLYGSPPHPDPLSKEDKSSVNSFCTVMRKIHGEFSEIKPHHYYVWPGVEAARNIFLLMPQDLLTLDENACSVIAPSLIDALSDKRSSKSRFDQMSLNAICIVPDGPSGSKLFQQLSKEKLGLKVKFLNTMSTVDGNASDCQVLIVTPAKLSDFIKCRALELESLKFLAFMYVDKLCASEDDRKILQQFKQEVLRYTQDVLKASRLFALTMSWSSVVGKFFDEWFRAVNPLVYMLDPIEASIYARTRHSFVQVTQDTLTRCLIEVLQKLTEAKHRVVICCQDADFKWIRDDLQSKSVTMVPLEPEFSGMRNEIGAQLAQWTVSPEKQCLLVPDSLLTSDELKLTNVGASAVVHAMAVRGQSNFADRLLLMKPTWLGSAKKSAVGFAAAADEKTASQQQTITESILLLADLHPKACNLINDLLVKSGSPRSAVIDNWSVAVKVSPTTKQENNNSTASTNGHAIATANNSTATTTIKSLPPQTNELCPNLLEFGKCTSESHCQMRHVLKADIDCVVAADKNSKFVSLSSLKHRAKFQILNVFSGSRFGALMREPVDCAEKLTQMTNRLRHSFKANNTQLASLNEGEMCGCAIDNGMTFRRAIIVKNLGIDQSSFYSNSAVPKEDAKSFTSFRVRLIDYGFIELEVSGDRLFPIDASLINEPWLTVDVVLVNIRPADRSWPTSSLEKLRKKMFGKEFEVSVALPLRHQILVSTLLHREMCSALGERATVTDIRSMLIDELSIGFPNVEHLRIMVDKCLEAGLYVPTDTRASYKPSICSVDSNRSQSQPNSARSSVLEELVLPIDPFGSITFDEFVPVRISSVTSPGTFFVQRKDSEDTLRRMERAIVDLIKQEGDDYPSISCEDLAPKTLCLARLPLDVEGTWSRVSVRRVDKDQKTVQVFAVDYGEIETIAVGNIRPISNHLKSYPAFAIECRLAHVQPLSSDDDDFSEDAGNALWDIATSRRSDRIFASRVLVKTKRGYYCKTCHIVELWPRVEDEFDAPPSESITELPVSTQLIRLAVVSHDWQNLKNSLSQIKFGDASDGAIKDFFTRLLPNLFCNSANDGFDQVRSWLDENYHRLANLFIENDEKLWAECVDHIVTMVELGDVNDMDFALEILGALLEPAINEMVECKTDSRAISEKTAGVLYNAARRLLSTAVFWMSLTLEECLESDIYFANRICETIQPLIVAALSKAKGNKFAKETSKFCVHSGIIAVLIHQLIHRSTLGSLPSANDGMFQLMNSLVENSVFVHWLRKMSSYKSNGFILANNLIETNPWEKLTEIVERIEQVPSLLARFLEALTALLLEEESYVTVVNDSRLGRLLQSLPEKLKPLIDAETQSDWKLVSSRLTMINTLSNVYWSMDFDPEVDPDRYGENRRRAYRLPRSDANNNDPAPMAATIASDDDVMFGTILWSQNLNTIHMQFDNSKITRANLGTRVGPDGKSLQLIILSTMKPLMIDLFGAIDENSLAVRDAFSGAVLKAKKRVPGDWTTLEAPGRRLANIKTDFSKEINFDWSDDEDDDDESDDDNNNSVRKRQVDGDGTSSKAAVIEDQDQLILQKARERLPEHFPGDGDEFDDEF